MFSLEERVKHFPLRKFAKVFASKNEDFEKLAKFRGYPVSRKFLTAKVYALKL